jgi:hypothetical protein
MSIRVAQIEVDGVLAGTIELKERTFSTGSRGYYGNGKIVIDGKRYQVGANIVEIGSKPKS